MEDRIEQATAAPGEKRCVPLPCECGHARGDHRSSQPARPCRECECVAFTVVTE